MAGNFELYDICLEPDDCAIVKQLPAKFDTGDWLIRATLENLKHGFALTGDTAEETTDSTTRTWTDTTGEFPVEAIYAGREGDSVKLKKADGSIITVPLKRLSRQDREYLRGKSP